METCLFKSIEHYLKVNGFFLLLINLFQRYCLNCTKIMMNLLLIVKSFLLKGQVSQLKKIPTELAQNTYATLKPQVLEGLRSIKNLANKNIGDFFASQKSYKTTFKKSKALTQEMLEVLLEDDMPDEYKEFATYVICKSTNVSPKFDHGNLTPDKYILKALETICKKNPKDKWGLRLSKMIERPQDYKETFQQAPLCNSLNLKQMGLRSFLDDRDTIIKTIIDCNLQNKDFPLEKTFGEYQLNALHIASWWGIVGEVQAIAAARKDAKLPMSPKDSRGRTPLTQSAPPATKLLLEFGANPLEVDTFGHRAIDNNLYPKSRELMINWQKREKILKSIAKDSLNLDI